MKFILPLLALIMLPATAGQYYRWVDNQGRVHYSDQPPPASLANRTSQKNYKGSVVEGTEPYVLRQARERFPVTLFATGSCGMPCELAENHLSRRGIPYASKDPSNDPEAQKLLAASGGKFRVPTLLVGNDKLDGYEEDAWNKALDRAGYPKSPMPGVKPAGVPADKSSTAAPAAQAAAAPAKP